jgi:hypothetical protein
MQIKHFIAKTFWQPNSFWAKWLSIKWFLAKWLLNKWLLAKGF